MKQFIIGILIILALVSCEDDHEVAWVSFRNETNYVLNIEFFATKTANGYKMRETLDTLHRTDIAVYYSGNQDINPCKLLAAGYDSIVIAIQNPSFDSIFFGKQSTPNYQINPFIDSDEWIYEEFYRDFPTNRSLNTTLIHNHILVISEDKILENQN